MKINSERRMGIETVTVNHNKMEQTTCSNEVNSMKPIRIFSHVSYEHPGYFCEYLEQRGIYYERIYIDRVTPILEQMNDVSGLVFLGSPVSVNKPLPWIKKELRLIKSASRAGIPILGICFGGQLISKALGGEVHTAPMMQIGWHHTTVSEYAKVLFNNRDMSDSFYAFEWHGDTFLLPQGATPLFNGDCIKNQGFVIKNSLALQFHPEITKTMVYEWLEQYAYCLNKTNQCIQSKTQILENIDKRLAQQRMVANQVFDWWLKQVLLFQQKQYDDTLCFPALKGR